MRDPAIQDFLDERKALWLKKKITGKTTDEEKLELDQEASVIFSLRTWLPDAANRAKQLSLVSHPGKFSHPAAKTSSIIATAPKTSDGFLRTGNVDTDLDVLGNAAALDVYKFLSINLRDGKTILTHLENQTALVETQLTVPKVSFSTIEQGLMAIKQDNGSSPKTSGRVKQVYFPVEDAYHLFSILTPSSIVYKLKERIMKMHFSDEAKEVRGAKRNNKPHHQKLTEIFGLSVVGYGGTKPQNISVLNSQNGGAAYLLSSAPPKLNSRTTQPPRINFFSTSLWPKAFNDDFQKFHKQITSDQNNIHVRRKRDWLIRSILFQVADRLWIIRQLEEGWSDSDNYQGLPQHQKIWLDQQYSDSREHDPKWLTQISSELARWFRNTYTKLLGSKALSLSDDQLTHIKKMIGDCQEALR